MTSDLPGTPAHFPIQSCAQLEEMKLFDGFLGAEQESEAFA